VATPDLLFVASVLVPPAVLVLCIVAMLLPVKASPSRSHEARVDTVSN